MKLLIYAFEPYGQHKSNISQQVLSRLRTRKNIYKVVLPVEFNADVLNKSVKNFKPDVILGLGQHPRGRKIRIERCAQNKRGSKTSPDRQIFKTAQSKVPTTLKLHPDTDSRISYNAGKFVCNYSMYVTLTNPQTEHLPFAFLHIPKSFNLNSATSFAEDKIDEILESV